MNHDETTLANGASNRGQPHDYHGTRGLRSVSEDDRKPGPKIARPITCFTVPAARASPV